MSSDWMGGWQTCNMYMCATRNTLMRKKDGGKTERDGKCRKNKRVKEIWGKEGV